MLKAALFDLDGVVFDTEPQYTIFWGGICKEFHPELPGLEYKIKGQTLVQIYDKYFDGELAKYRDEITDRLNAFEANMSFEYIDGLQDLLRELKEHGIGTAVVTSSNRPKMEAVYRQHPDFKKLFDYILTSEDFSKSKPDPECYLIGAGKFGAKPEECVGFEDSFNGLKAVRAAGELVVGLATTNDAEAIAPYSDVVIADYKDMNIAKIKALFGDMQKNV